MIPLYYSNDDPYSRYGIEHFIGKFGLAIQINKPSPSGIVLSYGSDTVGDFLISVKENTIQNNITGSVSATDGSYLICEIPHETGSGNGVIAFFDNGITRYPCITRNDHGIVIGIDIFRETGYILSGHLDRIRSLLSQGKKHELATRPTVDFLENLLFTAILAGSHQQQVPLIRKSFWPEGKKFAVCLTHDVDEIKKTYQWFSRPARYLARRDLAGFTGQIHSFVQKIHGIEPYDTFDDIISIERSMGAKSTYFILKESGQLHPLSKKTWYLYGRNRTLQSPGIRSLVKKLCDNGDEVALHGSYFSYTDPGLLTEEKQELEQLIQDEVIGTRQHNLNLAIPETWNLQVAAGLKYDTTLGFKDTIGFRWGTSFPFYPNTGEEPLPILEIPLTIMDICLESEKDKLSSCLCIAEEVSRYHGVLDLLWHPPIFNTNEYVDAREIYIRLVRSCLDSGAWIARAKDIYEWITARDLQRFSVIYHDSRSILTVSGPDPVGYYTIHPVPGTDCRVCSGNAEIVKKDGDTVYIRARIQPGQNTIIVGLS
jgi:hypothetical protein